MILPETADAAVPVQLTRLDCERDAVRTVPRTRVLIADDNVRSAQLLGDRLAEEGYVCEIASSADKALDIVRHLACGIVICDVQMRGSSEFELLDQIKILRPNLPI